MNTPRKLIALGGLGLLLAAGLAFFVSGCSSRTRPDNGNEMVLADPGTQTTCPIMGSKIVKGLYVDSGDSRIYVCCRGCLASVERDFDGALKKIEANGEIAATLQK